MYHLLIILAFISGIIDILYQDVYTPINILIFLLSLFVMKDANDVLYAFLIPMSLIVINLIYDKEMVGFGDIEFIAAYAPALGYSKTVMVFFIAVFMAIFSLIFKTKRRIAFIPFLSIALTIVIFSSLN